MEELLDRPMLAVVHPDDVESVGAVLAGRLDGEDMIGFEHRVICADGSVRRLQWNTRAVPERAIVYGVGRDVTDRRRADAELHDGQRMIEAGRDELRALADDQTALRRVATLVARGAIQTEVFSARTASDGNVAEVQPDVVVIEHRARSGAGSPRTGPRFVA